MNDDARADAELLAATAQDDSVAFGALVRRYIRSATLLAAQLSGDSDEAEDIVQEAFTIVYRKARRFDAARPFGPWFFSIVRRLAANRRSRAARRARLLRLWRGQIDAEPLSAQSADAVFARIDAAEAGRAMRDLSPMQRACFELVAIRGLSSAEVGIMHGISESTVRQHVFRARTALRSVLERQQREEHDCESGSLTRGHRD